MAVKSLGRDDVPPEKLIPLLMIPVMLVVVLLKNRRKRVLKPHLLWVMPAIVLPLIGLGLWGTAQNPNMAHAPWRLPLKHHTLMFLQSLHCPGCQR